MWLPVLKTLSEREDVDDLGLTGAQEGDNPLNKVAGSVGAGSPISYGPIGDTEVT